MWEARAACTECSHAATGMSNAISRLRELSQRRAAAPLPH